MSGLIHPVRSLRFNGGQIEIRASNPEVLYLGMKTSLSGGHRRGETPVPIPNTEVKPSTGDGTNGAVRWESSKLPGLIIKTRIHESECGFFIKGLGGSSPDRIKNG